MKQLTSLTLIFAVYLGLIAPFAATAQKSRRANRQTNMNESAEKGLKFRLGEGAAGTENRRTTEAAKTDALSNAETSNLLKRLPPVKAEADDKTDFAKRAGSKPAPKTGKIVPVKFPASEQRNAPDANGANASNALEVVRVSPAGAASLAPDLNVTFSQPMVAVTGQDAATQTVPVQLSPQPQGNWRWLGTKTLMFDATKRFPMATRFTARIPAGTRSATGQILQKDVVWTFETPPPTVETKFPENRTTRRDALVLVSFDQEINADAVIKTVSVTSGKQKIPVRLATAAEIAADETISETVKNLQPNRFIVLRAADELPPDASIVVTVEKGTASAEGDLRTTKAQSFSFKTYGALKFIKKYCSYDDSKRLCAPSDDWHLEFSNEIDAEGFDKNLVTIEPQILDLKIYAQGNSIVVGGAKPPRKSFKVSVNAALKDVYGQTLASNVSTVFNVGGAETFFSGAGGNLVVLDPFAAPVYSIYSTNYAAARVKIYRVQPTDWNRFARYLRSRNNGEKVTALPGKLVSDKVLRIKNTPDEFVETAIDLREFLSGGLGHLILDIEPASRAGDEAERKVVWIQSTKIGLDAFVDSQELVAFATDLRTGKPLGGVDLQIAPNGKAVSRQPSAVSEETKSAENKVAETNQSWSNWLVSWFVAPPENSKDASGETSAATLETVSQNESNTTAANGIARLALPDAQAKEQNVLIARRGNDVAFLPENIEYYYNETGNWYKKPDADSLRWFVFDDRKMYRPDEEVNVKGYVRKITGGKFGDVEAFAGAANNLTYSVKDARNNEIGKGTANLNAFGAFDFKFKLPATPNLGYSRIEFSLGDKIENRDFQHSFQIQEFRRPEFEVKAQNESPAPYFVKSSALVSVTANYFAGGGLANAETNWNVTATPTNYTPPNRDDFTFGKWFPWWRGHGGIDGETTRENFKGVTDASGKHVLKIDFDAANPARPYAVAANASVQDVNRQTWASATSLLVHPSELYVGIRTQKTFVQPNESFDVESIVTDIDGKLIANRNVEIKAVLRDWTFEKGEWTETVVEEQNCNIQSGEAAQKCTFTPKRGGNYTITARVLDDRERPNESELTVWVAGAKSEPKRDVEQEAAQLIPNKKDYAPGDVAEILVQSPFENAEGVLTLRRDGIVKTERFTIKGTSAVLRIPLEERYLPNVRVQVDLVGAAARADDGTPSSLTANAGEQESETKNGQAGAGEKSRQDDGVPLRPAFASGEINLPISKATRALTVAAEPRAKSLEPGGATKIDVAVKDNAGNAVADSEIALVVVDESILALTNYRMPNPLDVFYTERAANVTDYHSRANVQLADTGTFTVTGHGYGSGSGNGSGGQALRAPAPVAYAAMTRGNMRLKAESATMATDSESAQAETPIELRTNFSPLAVFAPSVRTDADGRAVVDIKLPDNLTRYRVMAVAVDAGRRFGKTESNLTAKQPLMVRPSAPRFMNFGDKIELPVVVQNQTDNPLTVDVAVRASNAELTGGGGRRVTIGANDRAEIRFPVSANQAGTARFQFAATSGKFTDAAEIELPVWTPATSEAFATYGTTDENGAIVQPVEAPKDVFEGFGGLEITTSSTQLQELTDAFIYLQNYPYECSEQVASRMISVAALQDVLRAFKAKEMPTDAELKAKFARDIEILKSRQRDDGSFGLWKRNGERYNFPFVSAHAAHALVLAKAKGYDVPDAMLNKSKNYLKNIEKHFDEYHKSPQVRQTISAYALYVRDLAGDKDAAKAKKLLADATIEKMPFEALGWILSVLANDKTSTVQVENIKRFLMNRTTETAATANFVTDYGDAEWLIMYSNRRADGVLLESLIKADPQNDLIPKLVRGLLDNRKAGRWSSTQENVFILLALDKYFNAFEKVTPDFVTRVWLGQTYAGEQTFKGRSVDSNLINVPMEYLSKQNGAANLILDRQGAGRVYYRIGLNYAPKNLNLKPADYGFTVLRTYEAVDAAEDVKRNPDNSWTIKSGARVRVRLSMVAPARRYHVALVDPLPAGLEILNPELATTEAIPADAARQSVVEYGSQSYGRGFYNWRGTWFEHQNFRDERAEAFSSLLWEGVYNYSYVARATTPGQFVVPPAKAEEMYHPETFGRTATDFVKVK